MQIPVLMYYTKNGRRENQTHEILYKRDALILNIKMCAMITVIKLHFQQLTFLILIRKMISASYIEQKLRLFSYEGPGWLSW